MLLKDGLGGQVEDSDLKLTIPDAVSKLVPVGSFGSLPIYNSSQLKRRGFFMLLYCKGGGGKTTLAASIADNPNIRPILLFDIDRSSHVISHRTDIDIGYIYKWEEMQEAASNIQSVNHPYKGIVIDNISVLADACLRYNQRIIHSADNRQHYAAMTSDMLNFISFWRDYCSTTGITVIMTAWEGAYEDEVTGLSKASALFNPALQKRFEGLFTMIGYLDVDEEQNHVLYFGQHKKRISKLSRSKDDVAQSIPLIIKDPNLGKIARTLIENEGYESAED